MTSSTQGEKKPSAVCALVLRQTTSGGVSRHKRHISTYRKQEWANPGVCKRVKIHSPPPATPRPFSGENAGPSLRRETETLHFFSLFCFFLFVVVVTQEAPTPSEATGTEPSTAERSGAERRGEEERGGRLLGAGRWGFLSGGGRTHRQTGRQTSPRGRGVEAPAPPPPHHHQHHQHHHRHNPSTPLVTPPVHMADPALCPPPLQHQQGKECPVHPHPGYTGPLPVR